MNYYPHNSKVEWQRYLCHWIFCEYYYYVGLCVPFEFHAIYLDIRQYEYRQQAPEIWTAYFSSFSEYSGRALAMAKADSIHAGGLRLIPGVSRNK